MAVNFVARKCACGGKLEYDPEKKVWICMYCGTVIEREATFDRVQVDGIEGINDVVRQTLMDIAYRRMDSAQRNLEDCQRKNHQHIGTLLAELSLCLTKISLTRDQNKLRGLLDKVKFLAKRLNEDFPVISVDEINLYESFGSEASDIFASLMVVFDTLKDTGRMEYISTKMNPGEIFSKEANRSLLKAALKQGKTDMADDVVNNTAHLDMASAFWDVLDCYPDGEKKRENLNKLMDQEVLSGQKSSRFETYFMDSGDSVQTKGYVLAKLADLGVKCRTEQVVKGVYPALTGYEEALGIFDSLCRMKCSDQEIEGLLVFALVTNKRYEVAAAYLDALSHNGCFVQVNPRTVISFLDSTSYDVEQTTTIFERLKMFSIEPKGMDALINYYLCNNGDTEERRLALLPLFLTEGCPITTSTVENYILKTRRSVEEKQTIISMIFRSGFNPAYTGDILSKYLFSTVDEPLVRERVTDGLIALGFKVDGKVLNQYISGSGDPVEVKVDKIRRLLSNGTQLRADSMDTYLLSLKNADDFSSELFGLVAGDNMAVSEQGLVRYLLECKDIRKFANGPKLLEAARFDLNTRCVSVRHLENEIVCNLFQGYVLVAPDGEDVMRSVAETFGRMNVRLANEILVNGKAMKFKKYVGEHKRMLSEITYKLCEENRMFSLF